MALSPDSSFRPASRHRPKALPRSGRRGSAVNSELSEKLRTIAAAARAPEEAIEPALLAILEGTKTPAGAVCLYDAQRQVLRLVAEVGLSDEGCKALRHVSPGSTRGWEMPQQSLLSRRAYVIENASENRFVPQLIDDPKAAYNVACLPLYAGTSPVGSLIIIAIRPTVFGEQHIKSLEQPLRELVTIIEALRERAAQARPLSLKSRLLPTKAESLVKATPAPDPAPSPLTESTPGQVARGQRAEPTAAQDQSREIQLLRTRLAESEARAAPGSKESVTALQQKHDELAREVEQLRAQLAEAEAAGVTRESQASQAHAAEVEHLLELLNDARDAATQEKRINQDLKSSLELERQQAAEALRRAAQGAKQATKEAAELERLRTQLAETQTAAAAREKELVANATTTHGELSTELERLRTQLAETAAATAAREDELTAQLQQKQQESAAELEAAAARERQINQEVAAALELERGSVAALKTELATFQKDRAAEVERLTALLTESEAGRARDTTHMAELDQASAQLAEKLEAARISEERLRGEVETAKHLADARVAEPKEAREHAALLEHGLGEARAETAALRDALAQAQGRIDELSRTLEQSAPKVEELDARAREAEDRRTQLERELDAAQAGLREAQEQLTASRHEAVGPSTGGTTQTSASSTQVEVVPADQPLESNVASVKARETSHRHVSVASAGRTRSKPSAKTKAATAPEESGQGRVIIIDREESWSGVALDERQATFVSPGADLSALLSDPHRDPILLNLATPGSLGVVSALREAGLNNRFLAYIGAPGTEKALRLGMIETTPSPLDPEMVLAALEGYVAAGTRLLTAGADVDAVMSLRQALSRKGVSVSMAWDSTQAMDLVTIIRPEIAVIDLDLPPRNGYALVSTLADMNPVPSVVLISKGTDAAERFAAEAVDRTRARSLIPLDSLLAPLPTSKQTANPSGS